MARWHARNCSTSSRGWVSDQPRCVLYARCLTRSASLHPWLQPDTGHWTIGGGDFLGTARKLGLTDRGGPGFWALPPAVRRFARPPPRFARCGLASSLVGEPSASVVPAARSPVPGGGDPRAPGDGSGALGDGGGVGTGGERLPAGEGPAFAGGLPSGCPSGSAPTVQPPGRGEAPLRAGPAGCSPCPSPA